KSSRSRGRRRRSSTTSSIFRATPRSASSRTASSARSRRRRRKSEHASVRILLIEDEDSIAGFIVRGLREEGFLVERAADGEAGWHHLKTGTWDVVLLDWWLPGTDGLTLLRRYRQLGGAAPVLFLTARDAVSDRVRGLDAGAEDYLCKPFAFEE